MRWRRPDKKAQRWEAEMYTGAYTIEAALDPVFGQVAYHISHTGRRYATCWSLASAKQTAAETDRDIQRNTARGMGR